MPMLIGITGKALSGKDTFAEILFRNYNFLPMAFAVPLKQAAAAAYGIDLAHFHSQEGKKQYHEVWKETNRVLLQDFGELMCERYGAGFWIRRWLIDYAGFSNTDDVVVSDVRKDVEAETIRDLGGLIVHLERDGAGLSGKEAAHKTEQGVTKQAGDVVIWNNGTLHDLARQADRAVAILQGRAK
ncbi:deoxynucleotide monophosphate kinase family protein [Ferribacterium limneticum]|uniref:deoxynucleotide monophosphate kinase family protein n=1 Tax=Ferribacterium limneticum TaxID=76259 RepID=UPI001CF89E2C|nr:hypothetical protein [Ferribacterium limneticum]UCV26715.1 hypothetical protein KI617_10380 [Ferribacterium limneticum]UCV30632.1 hypothetical protein KI608_10380 [Ferribacterium limneticum]